MVRGKTWQGFFQRFALLMSVIPFFDVMWHVSLQALFLWIVRLINTSLGKGEETLPFIGVLDIFGQSIESVVSPRQNTKNRHAVYIFFFSLETRTGWRGV